MGITSIKVVDSAERIYEVRCNHVFAERDERIRMMTDEGYKFIVPMPNVGQAIEQAFTVIGNEDVTMKDCNIWSAAKFMFFLNGNDGVIKFQNVHITPAPGEDAHIVGWRDGFHCKENRAQLIWRAAAPNICTTTFSIFPRRCCRCKKRKGIGFIYIGRKRAAHIRISEREIPSAFLTPLPGSRSAAVP